MISTNNSSAITPPIAGPAIAILLFDPACASVPLALEVFVLEPGPVVGVRVKASDSVVGVRV